MVKIIFVWLIGGLAVSIMSAFLYRWACVTQSIRKLHSKCSITIMVAIHIFYSFPIYASALYGIYYDNEAVLADVKEVRYFRFYRKSVENINCFEYKRLIKLIC